MKAIQVKYLDSTETKGNRLKASAEGVKAITEPRDYQFDVFKQAEQLANRLANRHGWIGGEYRLVGGQLPKGDYAFVIVYGENQ